ncbi:SPASM domain-containing protein [Candidatus Dependentiae bacterium]|nr:SPASM domain-containing protein [Candidatus Dependentiae bacterium]
MEEYVKTKNVEFNIYTTYKCNLRCTYCCREAQEGIHERSSKIEWTLDDIEKFTDTYFKNKHIYITWNGGEPAINAALIEKCMRRFPQWEYQMQTNATLLHLLPDYVVQNLKNLLCSNDGLEVHTDRYRGKGVFKTILEEIKKIKQRGYKGTVTSRMTFVTDDIKGNDVLRLITEYGYDMVFWQLPDDNLNLLNEKYMDNAKQFFKDIVDIWFAHKTLLRFIPVMGAIRNIMWPDRTAEDYLGKTQCRVSENIMNLMPSGDIYPCPQLTDKPKLFMGNIIKNVFYPSQLQRMEGIDCFDCSVFDICRTRCMYQKYKVYVEKNDYEKQIMEKHCELAKYFLNYIKQQDCNKKIASLTDSEVAELKNNNYYKYVELMM